MTTKSLEEITRDLQHTPPARLAGAVKTYPLRHLLKIEQRIKHRLLKKRELSARQERELQTTYLQIQEIIAKRIEAAHKLILKFSNLTPEIIALNNSVFSLVPSRDVLEDVKTAFTDSPEMRIKLSKASANILEAVNIEIQQRFYESSPENIAISYSGKVLDSYRKLLKNLLTHIEVDSDIFKIYNSIIRNVIEGTRIYETHISTTRSLCNQIFQTLPPAYDKVLSAYTAEELAHYYQTIQTTLAILERDITGRPSIIEFTNQCRLLLHAITAHSANRKLLMRKTTRVLQLSHYISFLSTENVAENALTSLMLCELLFDEIQQFLTTQQKHLDAALNVKSIEEGQQKIRDGLQYRLHAVGQLFQEISSLSPADLSFVSEKCLGDSNLLLQEIQHLVDDYMYRTASAPPTSIATLANSLRATIQTLQEAIAISHTAQRDSAYQPWEFERSLPNLSKFYDQKLISLIKKALQTGSSRSDVPSDKPLEELFTIPVALLRNTIEQFIHVVSAKQNANTDFSLY